ncbi:MAG: hypothetical protein KY476_02445 [Planctomycetes bacterium]|nr:hypothetical protein [Planctomycetota bacterium]
MRKLQVAVVWAVLAVLAGWGVAQDDAAKPEAKQEAPDEKIDFEKARGLLQKLNRGEKLTPDKQKYLDRAREQRRNQRPGNRSQRPGQPPEGGRESIGVKPLTELSADEDYKGQSGGLYGGGRNEPPEQHLQAALAAAKQIRPLDADGGASPNGKMVLISVGMSNTTQEFSQFVRLAGKTDPTARVWFTRDT